MPLAEPLGSAEPQLKTLF